MYLAGRNINGKEQGKGEDEIQVLQIDDIAEHLEAIFRCPYKVLTPLEMDMILVPGTLWRVRLLLVRTLEAIAERQGKER